LPDKETNMQSRKEKTSSEKKKLRTLNVTELTSIAGGCPTIIINTPDQ
jgi:hypothetical protein